MRRCLIESNGLDKPGSIWDNINLVYFSLDGPPDSSNIIRDIPSEGTAETLLQSSAVGDVLGYFLINTAKLFLVREANVISLCRWSDCLQ